MKMKKRKRNARESQEAERISVWNVAVSGYIVRRAFLADSNDRSTDVARAESVGRAGVAWASCGNSGLHVTVLEEQEVEARGAATGGNGINS